MSILSRLTEGIASRDLQREGAALLNKWEKTGLLEGLDSDIKKQTMSRLLENQAKQLLKETSSMAGAVQGDVEGFASVAFPIVRRVFGGLIANDLVSVQPMSLPSGLIFFLDFKFSSPAGSKETAGALAGESIYGGGVVGMQLTGGVSLDDTQASELLAQEKGFYNLSTGYASPTGSSTITPTMVASGSAWIDYTGRSESDPSTFNASYYNIPKYTRYDPDMSGTNVAIATMAISDFGQFNEDAMTQIWATKGTTNGHGAIVRRLTQVDPEDKTKLLIVLAATASFSSGGHLTEGVQQTVLSQDLVARTTWKHAITDKFVNSTAPNNAAIGAVAGQDTWGLEGTTEIPEIDIKVDSVAVTAITKKLKAKWTPELGQDLNAYHNLDAEVELTSILSEQIALEIDREILEDLLKGATGGRLFWSRSPGLFVNRETGGEVGAAAKAPDFTGTVSEWYETLLETVNDVSARIHRKTLRGGANFLVTSPEVANILEFTSGFRASVTADVDRGTAGTVKTGSISKKWEVYVDPYFPRNVLLVGRKGSSFLESGYVYAPYVPLQVTPTIFGVEDFVPRKGVMTRYAKKMVRPDMYGIVIVRGLIGESGDS